MNCFSSLCRLSCLGCLSCLSYLGRLDSLRCLSFLARLSSSVTRTRYRYSRFQWFRCSDAELLRGRQDRAGQQSGARADYFVDRSGHRIS